MIREFGWEVKQTRSDKMMLTNGEEGLMESTTTMYEKAKASMTELLKAADKCYDLLLKKKKSLSSQACEDIQMIKKFTTVVQGHMATVNEVNICIHVYIYIYVCNHIQMYTYTCVHIYIHTYTYVYIYIY